MAWHEADNPVRRGRMVDIATVKYKISVLDGKAEYGITDFLEQLSWEESEGEVAMRVSATLRNGRTGRGQMSSLVKPGCTLIVSAKHGGGGYQEVARGTVAEWDIARRNSAGDVRVVCYDRMYSLQKSQDNFYFRFGSGTKARVSRVLKKWGIPMGEYQGPDKKHGKKKYQNRCLSDILPDILDDAAKKGGRRCILRMEKGKAVVVPRGSNEDVYVLKGSNAMAVDSSRSTAELVTRVKILGKPGDDGKDNVAATVDGLTKYGVYQKIYTMAQDEPLKDAKKAAGEILESQGRVGKKVSVQCPDVPYVRKGDLVYIQAGGAVGYYYVTGIRHDAASMSMSVDAEEAEEYAGAKGRKVSPRAYRVADTVDFKGGKCFMSPDGKRFFPAKAGMATVTKKKASGKHPFHLVHADLKGDVYGWVDEGQIG